MEPKKKAHPAKQIFRPFVSKSMMNWELRWIDLSSVPADLELAPDGRICDFPCLSFVRDRLTKQLLAADGWGPKGPPYSRWFETKDGVGQPETYFAKWRGAWDT